MSKGKELKREEKNNRLAIFEGAEIRKVYFDHDWYYVIEDIIKALTDSKDPKGYIKDMRRRDKELSKGWGQIATPLPIETKGGKQLINCANNEGVLRLVQTVPSKKAEPFKRWLAKIGAERIEEIEQPAKAIERAKGYYLQKGYSPDWVQTRIAGIDTRVTFTDKLKESGIKEGFQYAVLTNEMYESWSGFTAAQYKEHKGISKKDSLRDNMTPMELATTLFSETAAKELIEKSGAKGFIQTKNQIHIAGNITKEALTKLEKETGKKVVTHENMKSLNSVKVQKELAQSKSDNAEAPDEE
ncbi:Bro-N domain-containing protein [Fulvivirga sp. M361]|uniref:BRO-N domain-containing protein n=1 Tax=Fulvivirga sp. M361 TaxID=2594266 RepID=UPI00117BB5AC|nr:Bro-N domain-containing protein [Fulvivirga sp. M361]TRX58811.1 Bro-N domain-containing protein [Fulvivirga sp. M361]